MPELPGTEVVAAARELHAAQQALMDAYMAAERGGEPPEALYARRNDTEAAWLRLPLADRNELAMIVAYADRIEALEAHRCPPSAHDGRLRALEKVAEAATGVVDRLLATYDAPAGPGRLAIVSAEDVGRLSVALDAVPPGGGS